jgi:hypothetical protein
MGSRQRSLKFRLMRYYACFRIVDGDTPETPVRELQDQIANGTDDCETLEFASAPDAGPKEIVTALCYELEKTGRTPRDGQRLEIAQWGPVRTN